MFQPALLVRCFSSKRESVPQEELNAACTAPHILNNPRDGGMVELTRPWFNMLTDIDGLVAQDAFTPTWIITPTWLTAHQIYVWWYRWKRENDKACAAFGAYDEVTAPTDEEVADSVIEDDSLAGEARGAFEVAFQQLLDCDESDKLISICCFYGNGKRFVMYRSPRAWVTSGLVSNRIALASFHESCFDGKLVGKTWAHACAANPTTFDTNHKAHMVCVRSYDPYALITLLRNFETREQTQCIFGTSVA